MENREICCGSCSSGYLPVDSLFSFFSEAAAAFCLDAKDSALPPYPMLPIHNTSKNIIQQKQARLERKKIETRTNGIVPAEGSEFSKKFLSKTLSYMSGRFFLLISQHLRPTRDNCSACIRGQSPADESNIACKQPFATARCTSFKRPNPDLPVKSRRSMIPKEYTSDRGVRSPEIAYSGSMYTKVPFGWVWRYRVVVALNSSVNIRHTPKPLSLATLFPSRRMLDAFKSLQAPG
uniref:Uncharacterized protein n=1 Tax=Oryza glumipatula TaxID=40148 RepID=A0A0E0B6V4_9ORYZ